MKLTDLVKHPNVSKVELSMSINPEDGKLVATLLVLRRKNTMILDVTLDPETYEVVGDSVFYNEIEHGADEPTFSNEAAFRVDLLPQILKDKSL